VQLRNTKVNYFTHTIIRTLISLIILFLPSRQVYSSLASIQLLACWNAISTSLRDKSNKAAINR